MKNNSENIQKKKKKANRTWIYNFYLIPNSKNCKPHYKNKEKKHTTHKKCEKNIKVKNGKKTE